MAAFTALCHRMCDASGEFITRYFRQPVEVIDKADKGPGVYSPVTKADRGAEKSLVAALVREWNFKGSP